MTDHHHLPQVATASADGPPPVAEVSRQSSEPVPGTPDRPWWQSTKGIVALCGGLVLVLLTLGALGGAVSDATKSPCDDFQDFLNRVQDVPVNQVPGLTDDYMRLRKPCLDSGDPIPVGPTG